MTTIGFKNIPFNVGIAMHAAIHANHQVALSNGGDGRLTFPSGGTSMVFTPANYATPQQLQVNVDGVGDIELLADVTNDYFVNGAGTHRTKRFIIDLSITALPIDAWTGSIPGLNLGGAGGGNLKIFHRALDAVHNATITIAPVSGRLNTAGFVSHNVNVHVTRPNGTSFDTTAFSSLNIPMTAAGIWQFEVGADAGTVGENTAGQYTVQASTWNFFTDDGVGSTVTATISHQGCTYVNASGFATLPNGTFGPVTALTLDQNTCVSAPVFVPGTVTVQTNCTGCTMAGTSTGITISGTRINNPFTLSANGDFHVESSGVNISGTLGAFING